MSLKIIIFVLLAASGASYFVPTPQQVRNSFISGQNYFAARNYPMAIEQYNKVLNTESNLLTADSIRVTLMSGELSVGVRTAAMYQKANAWRNLGRMDTAIALFRLAQSRPDTPKLLALSQYQIYDIFFQNKQYDSALTEARKLIANYPGDEKVEQAYYDIGWTFRIQKQYDSSSAAFTCLFDTFIDSPYRIRALYQVGQNAVDVDNWEKALQTFKLLVATYKPESFSKTDFQNIELRANRERQIFDAASNRESENTSLELVSKSEFKIAEAYEHLNQFDSSIQRYRYIIRTYTLMPTLVEISYIKMAELTLRVKGLEPAIDVYRKAIDENFQNKVFQARMQYKIAWTYQDNNHYTRAAEEYDFYTKVYAEYAEAAEFSLENGRFFAVLNYYADKAYKKTIAASDSFLVYHSESEFVPKALVMRGTSFQNINSYEQARTCFQSVVDRFPTTEEATHARMQLARTYYEEKKYDLAIANYTKLLGQESAAVDTSEAHYYLGMSHFFVAHLDSAQNHLSRVHSTSPYYPFAFARNTKIYSSKLKFEEGERYIAAVIRAAEADSSKHRAYAHLSYGDLLAAWGKFEPAAKEMALVLRDTTISENAKFQAIYGRGALNQQLKKYAEAIKDLQYCLAQPNFVKNFSSVVPAAQEKLALSLLGIGKKKEGLERLQALLSAASNATERIRYMSALLEIYSQSGDQSRVIEFGTKIVNADSADENSRARAYVSLANTYGNQNNADKMSATVLEAAERLPRHPYIADIMMQTAQLFYDAQAYEQAAAIYGKFIATNGSDPRSEDALYYRTLALVKQGRADDGIASLRTYLAKYPASTRRAEAQFELAENYFNSKRFDQAIREYERTAHDYPKSPFALSALFNKGWCYLQMKDTASMVQSFETLVALHPQSQEAADAQFSIGDYYYNKQKYEKAREAYTVIVTKFPENARAGTAASLIKELDQINSFKDYEVAMRPFDAKDYKKAIELLGSVIKKHPDSEVRYACEVNIASAYEETGQKKKSLELFTDILTKYKDVPAAQSILFFAEQHKRWIESGKTE